MDKASLIAQLKSNLSDIAEHINGSEDDMLDTAINHLNQLRPKVKSITLHIASGVGSYDSPTDLLVVNRLIWQETYQVQPWQNNFIAVWPECFIVNNKITLSPKPTNAQINAVGSSAMLHYHAKRDFSDLSDYEADLVVIRAMAQAMRLESIRKSNKPVQLRDGQSPNPKNATPSSLYEAFLQEFKEGCRG